MGNQKKSMRKESAVNWSAHSNWLINFVNVETKEERCSDWFRQRW